jgi:hypothetical protein
VEIERELRKRGYQYLRKRQSKSEARRLVGNASYHQLSKFDLAKAVAACELEPDVVLEGKEKLFEEHYSQIFCSSSSAFCLSRYWLMRHMRRAVRVDPRYKYGQWLTLNFAWNLTRTYIASGEGERQFRYSSEKCSKPVECMCMVLEQIYRSVIEFYRLKRGRGVEEKAPNAFFKDAHRNNQFRSFWRSSRNSSRRQKTQRFLQKFKRSLSEVSIPD